MRSFLVSIALALAACSSGLDVDPPENGLQLRMPPTEVAPGKEVLLCTYLKPLDKELMIKSFTMHQTPGGHHAALFSVISPQASGTNPCADPETAAGGAEMANWRPVAAGVDDTHLPPGVGLRIPAGKQLMMQSHFVNAGAEVMVSESAINLTSYDGTPAQVADYLVLNELNSVNLPRGESSMDRECVQSHDVNIISMLGHLHQYGILLRVELEALDGTWNELYKETDGKLLRERPPTRVFPPEAPMVVKAGQKWRYTCGWNNTTDHEIKWPEEMCATFMMYYPSKGFIVCNDGVTSTLD